MLEDEPQPGKGKVPVEELFLRARIPRNHWECKLSAIPVKASHYEPLSNYIQNIRENIQGGRGLYFSNQPGRGKSGAAAVVAKCALAHRFSVFWVEAQKVIKYKIEQQTEIFDDNMSVYERAESCDLLVIDEFYVGSNQKEDYYIERLIRTRIDAQKPTIITSNMSETALKQKYRMLHSVLSEAVEFVTFDPIVNFRPKQ